MADNKGLSRLISSLREEVKLLLEEFADFFNVISIEECIYLVQDQEWGSNDLSHGKNESKSSHRLFTTRQRFHIDTVPLTGRAEIEDDLRFERLVCLVWNQQTCCTLILGKLTIVDRKLCADLVEEGNEFVFTLLSDSIELIFQINKAWISWIKILFEPCDLLE